MDTSSDQPPRICVDCPTVLVKPRSGNWPQRCPPCAVKRHRETRLAWKRRRSQRRKAAKAGWRRRKLAALPVPTCLDCPAELPKARTRSGQRTTRAQRLRCPACSAARTKRLKAERHAAQADAIKAARRREKEIRLKHSRARPRTCKDCPAKLVMNPHNHHWPLRCPVCAERRDKATLAQRLRRSRRRRRGIDIRANIRMDFLGNSARRVASLLPRCGLTHVDLVNEGWLAVVEAMDAGETERRAYRRAEQRMEAAARSEMAPLSGDTKALRHVKFVGELHPDYPGSAPSHYSRRLTPRDWRQLKATFRRVLVPNQAHVLTRMVCEHAGVFEVAMEMGLTDTQVVMLRSRGLRRMREWTAAA